MEKLFYLFLIVIVLYYVFKNEKEANKLLQKQDLITDMPQEIPYECKRFSWGAFCLPLFFVIFNKTYKDKLSILLLILCCIPFLGLIPGFFLGKRSNEMAYKYKTWKSVGHFNRMQRNWARVPGYFFLLCFILGIFSV